MGVDGALRRVPLVARLLGTFIVVSIVPIGTLASLALWEASEAREGDAEQMHGLSVTVFELAVAGLSLVLSIVVALAVARSLTRPLRELDQTIARVEGGDLRARASVAGADELADLAGAFNRMVDGLEREAVIRDLFGQYVTPELASAAIEHRGHLDGQLVTSTVLFSDIRDFTGISESLPASALISMLNRYFDRMSRVIVDAGGLLNKFGGDSMLAIFGSPLNPAPDHAARAVAAARALSNALARFNDEQRAAFLPEIMVGIGVASGDVVAGNVGSPAKLEYTVIGDAVNVAARLQAMTSELGESMLFSAETARLAAGAARFEPVGAVDVRGKARPVTVLRLVREHAPTST